jgi:multiple sugar transport system ATP-binding protein
MVFQNYALYPQKSVYKNLAFPLQMRRLPRDEIDRKVREAARVLDMTQLLERKPRELSGGQQQRVALGRALVRDPAVFLMDEPLSNLDAKLRVQMRSEVARIQHELKATTVYVTHDQVEAMTMGDRVALMRRGVLQQVDTPMELYNRPANLFVASFIGSPSMNLFEAELNQRNGQLVATIGDQFLRLEPTPSLDRYAGRKIALGIRPEHIEDAAVQTDGPSERRLNATVTTVEALGSELIAHLEIAGRPVLTDEVKEIAADLDDTAVAALEHDAEDQKLPLVARFDVASRVRHGARVEVVVDTTQVHCFDLDSGEAIGRAA